ncbi:MAG: alpha/beta hydrolase [Leptospiraceae bacterium]|nr:alpha/beta hydrolase [Leptospiraceae bacterium]
MARRPSIKRKNPWMILSSILLLILAAFAAGGAAIIMTGVLLLLVLFYPFFLGIWQKLYGTVDIADQLFYAHTKDGWNVAMHFHRPDYPRPGAYPVILCHGIAVNKFGVDLDRAHSLAYYLKQNGFPVFVLSLRGVGKSYHSSKHRYQDFSFDDLVTQDVPAVIQRACELTGAPKINWVGHSMGAMIAMGYMGQRLPLTERIACLVNLGGPGKLDHARQTLWGMLSKYPWMNQIVDFRFGAQVISPISGRITTPFEELVFNRENVNAHTIRRMMKNGIENIAKGLATQMMGWIQRGDEVTLDGNWRYRDGFQFIKAPALFVAGSRDHIAVPAAVQFAYENCGSKVKDFIVLGLDSSAQVEYCHTGLVLGDYAIEDVYPLVLDWVERHGIVKKHNRLFSLIKKRTNRVRNRRFKRDHVRSNRGRVAREGSIQA